jgi:pimeloyl-ACP methyl ester carboxylesterase
MGGRVAQLLAIDHTPRVGALVLGATTAGDERGFPRTAQATADLTSGDPQRLARLFFRDEELHRHASRTHDAWDVLDKITAPTLVIHGTDDELTPPENARLIAGRIPGAELELRS